MTTETSRTPDTLAGGTTHTRLQAWVDEVAALTTPAEVVWVTGSDPEWARLTDRLVEAGTFTRLDPATKPNSFYARSTPNDVARVEDRTYICSREEKDAGPTNNWMDPEEMKDLMRGLYAGCMRGRTMYVIPFVMGHLNSPNPMFGVEITDSEYVVVSMRVMSRCGVNVLRRMEETQADYVPGLHSVGAPLEPGQQDVRWPCSDTKYIVHFPEERTIWSYGSGYGGNALLGKKCYALRIASAMARDEGWLAEHMLILKLISPEQQVYYIAAAFPSACGKTNLAMLQPTIPGWTVETLGDDIAWMRFGEDGRLYAVNPEFGFFGVAPGTNEKTNPNAMRTIEKGNSVFTNVALTDDGDIWWEGMETRAGSRHVVEGRGLDPRQRRAQLAPELPLLHSDPPVPDPRRRVRRPPGRADLGDLLRRSAQDDGPARDRVARLGARDVHGRDPLLGDHRGGHRRGRRRASRPDGHAAVHRLQRRRLLLALDRGRQGRRLRQAPEDLLRQLVPASRPEDGSGDFLWPGFGENARVLKWAIERIEGKAAAVETPIGHVPTPESLDTDGLDMTPAELEAALAVDVDEWRAEIPEIEAWFEKIGDSLPTQLQVELDGLKARLGLD